MQCTCRICWLLLQRFEQDSREKEIAVVVLLLKPYLALSNKLQNTIPHRKLFAELNQCCRQRTLKLTVTSLTKIQFLTCFVNWSSANIYYLYYCNKILLLQLLVNNSTLSSIMIYFNLKWDIEYLIPEKQLWLRL